MRGSATAGVIVGLALFGAACGGGGRTTPQFTVPETVEGRVAVPELATAPVCRLSVGSGNGVEVVSVEPDLPASEQLQPGDVINGVDGVMVDDSGDFIGIVRSRDVGDSVTMSVSRVGDEPFEADIELVAHVDGSGEPMIGIGVRTAVELLEAASVETTGPVESPLTTVVSVGGSLYALDPVAGNWLSLERQTPSEPWTPAAGAIYTLIDGEPDQVVNVTDPDASIEFDVDGWNGRWVLGSQGALVLVYADREAETGVQGSIFAVDPATGVVAWFWLPQDAEPTVNPIPIFAVSSPSQDRTLVATALFDDEGNAQALRFSLLDRNGEPGLVASPVDELPAGLVAIGWFNDSQIAYHQPSDGTVLLRDVDTGDLESLTLPVEAGTTAQFFPVGDGTHLIMITAGGLDLIRAGDGPSTRPLAVDCVAERITPPGFVG